MLWEGLLEVLKSLTLVLFLCNVFLVKAMWSSGNIHSNQVFWQQYPGVTV